MLSYLFITLDSFTLCAFIFQFLFFCSLLFTVITGIF